MERSASPLNWDLHTAGGFYAIVFLLVLSFTGAYLCLPVVGQGLAVLTGGHAHDSETLFASTPSTSPEGAPDASLQQIMLQAGALRSGYRARFFELPQRKSDAVTVFLDDGSQERTGAFLLAGFDRRDGHLLQLVDARDFRLGLRLMLLLGPLHFGTFGGATTKILWVLLGLSPGALFFTGFFIWWRRVMRKRLVRASGASC